MKTAVTAKILSIGNELASGQVVDTNSAYLAGRLARAGIEVGEHCTVGDDIECIRRAIVRLAGRCDVLLVTGGLGPTADDLTRQALAAALGVELVIDRQCLAEIEDHFRRRGWKMVASNKRQALLPVGAEALANPYGTAPGIAADLAGCRIYVMPGVPGEMRHMLDDQIAPRLPVGSKAIVHRLVHTFGVGESGLGDKIADLMDRQANPTVGTTVSAGMVSIRITARGETADQAGRLAEAVVDELKARLGELVVGTDDQGLGGVVGELLDRRRATLATAESCTGGLIGKLITDHPGSSRHFVGGVVAYSNQVKQSVLAVPAEVIAAHGAVSEPTAKAMAEGVSRSLGADYGLAVTGVAGPGGGTADKPVGMVCLALAKTDGSTEVRTVRLGGDRAAVRLRAALSALNMLRLELLKH